MPSAETGVNPYSKAMRFLPRARVGIALEIYRDGELIVTLTDPIQQFNNDVPGSHEWEFHFVSTKEGILSYGVALL